MARRKEQDGFVGRTAQALAQLRDAIVRNSQIGKIKLDTQALRRERDQLFQRLGARFYDAVAAGEPVSGDEPSFAPLIERLRELEEALLQQDAELEAVQAEAELQREAERRSAEVAAAAAADGADDKYVGIEVAPLVSSTSEPAPEASAEASEPVAETSVEAGEGTPEEGADEGPAPGRSKPE